MTAAKNVKATFNLIPSTNPAGTTTGLTNTKVTCANISTNKAYKATLINNNWDCVAAGMASSKDDIIIITIKGFAQ